MDWREFVTQHRGPLNDRGVLPALQPFCNRLLSFDNRALVQWETFAAVFPRYSPIITADIAVLRGGT
jgi:hypothetical protein